MKSIFIGCMALAVMLGSITCFKIAGNTGVPNETVISNTSENAELDIKTAEELLSALDITDKIGACAVSFDEKCGYTAESGEIYYKVTDMRFKTAEDLRFFINKYLTAEFVEKRYANLLDSTEPLCIDINGELYIKYAPKGGGFAFTDTMPEIKKISESEYMITAEHDNYGAKENMCVYVIQDGENFKINNIEF